MDPAVIAWLRSKSDEWHQLLYALLFRYGKERGHFGVLDQVRIVRLASGTYSIGSKAYFPTGPVELDDPLPRVAEPVLTSGNRKGQQADARAFLESIGVRSPGEAEEIRLILATRYSDSGDAPDDDVYLADLKRFIAYAEHHPDELKVFNDVCLFRVLSDEYGWASSSSVYLDEPFIKTGLTAYYAALEPEARERLPLSKWYLKCEVAQNRLVKFAEAVGCETRFTSLYEEVSCFENPKWGYLCQVPGERYTSPVDKDFALTDSAAALLGSKDVNFSKLVWSTMCGLGAEVLQACYRKNWSGGSRWAESRLVHQLRQAEWVPLKDGRFVAPRQATREALLAGFSYDSGSKWLEQVQFGTEERLRAGESAVRAANRAELGFETEEELQRAQAFVKHVPLEEQERFIAQYKARQLDDGEAFPERPARNAALRGQRVREQATDTPVKGAEVRARAVSMGYDAAKAMAQVYLQEQYTNSGGTMFCQVCKAPLPFKLPRGSYYFEAVELSGALAKRYRETFLSMCPNHAAMFKHANEQKDSMTQLVLSADTLEIGVTLGGTPTTIQFTETHLADIQACIRAEE